MTEKLTLEEVLDLIGWLRTGVDDRLAHLIEHDGAYLNVGTVKFQRGEIATIFDEVTVDVIKRHGGDQ